MVGANFARVGTYIIYNGTIIFLINDGNIYRVTTIDASAAAAAIFEYVVWDFRLDFKSSIELK